MGLETLGLMGASAGMQGLASLFQGADPAQLSAYVDQPGQYLDPADQMEQHLKDRYQLGGVLTGKAERPVTLPGAFAQPLPWYSGGGLPFSVGVTAQDPALYAPGLHQQRAGYQFAQPDYQKLADKRWTGQEGYLVDPKGGGSAAPAAVGNWMFGEYAPRFDPNAGFMKNATDAQWGPQTFAALDQPQYGVDQPQVGGGIPQLKANLELIGVTSNPDGTFRADAPETPVGNPQLFSGTKGVVNPERERIHPVEAVTEAVTEARTKAGLFQRCHIQIIGGRFVLVVPSLIRKMRIMSNNLPHRDPHREWAPRRHGSPGNILRIIHGIPAVIYRTPM